MEDIRKRKETVSVSINELVEGSHLFKVTSYSLLLERDCSDPVQSTPFEVGGHSWAINFYPQYFNEHASVYVEKLSEGFVRAKTQFNLLDQSGKPSGMTPHDDVLFVFGGEGTELGYGFFIRNKDLPSYLQDDSLTIRCTLRVFTSSVKQLVPPPLRETPTWKVRSDLGKLLESGEGADVLFDVKGKLFSAHKFILAARSPYFRAQFFGLMRKLETVEHTKVEVVPAVFEAFLRYVYTDSFLEIEKPGVDDEVQLSQTMLAQKLLSVLKIIYEDILLEEICDIDNVAQFLALAERHKCDLLRHACLDCLADPKTLALMMLTEEFLQLMKDNPSVLKEIKGNISHPILEKALSRLENSDDLTSDST
ncbi:BTB/POZ and MATH domain-containing protein 2-like protein [Carex littledalei]|uniref:BTB/POZ and MATH domain-containing protein 2-like protein n=1 Tax=Carex littledalei TaxID=544730 RepID=A0A833QHH2_9POAL|nr:BTB/POZ and MATH domain-containing protein 2-like protein [Carex littledalei]